jgi:hypothetical protein
MASQIAQQLPQILSDDEPDHVVSFATEQFHSMPPSRKISGNPLRDWRDNTGIFRLA